MKNILKKLGGNEKGFSLTEITIVLIILAIGFGFSVLYTQTIQVQSDLKSISSNFVGLARTAQSNANSGKQGVGTGVHLDTKEYVLFEGGVYDPNAPTNYTVEMPSTIDIQNINLNGGGSEVIFLSPKGETNTHGTFSFFSSQNNKSIPITITNIGSIQY
ncbi:hypothetical protein COY05_00790 [Candidatus Peregrinibacteria bacterium CG_4_10_14_0_2_um_filter_38_24]|nr:MAG: hypothetical protein COY05_00790 [Candidatus Peregrinibacteria bacterium CG_4_10_14_0_2_um_filter_38_24]